MKRAKKVTVVVPVYNEEPGIKKFVDTLIPELEKLKTDYELLFVNDGSKDGTLSVLQELANDKTRIVSLSRNFGKEAALSAGILYADGDAVLTIDADGQHPVGIINEFVEKWEDGAEVVVGVRKKYDKHGLYKKIGSRIFYKLLRVMGNNDLVENATDYRLMDRVVVDEFNKMTEHNRITRGLIDWLGFRCEYIEYVPEARVAGVPSYDGKKLMHLALDSFVSMSTKPLMLFGYLGLLITLLSFALGLFCIIQQHILGDPLGLKWNGTLEMMILVAFLIGLLMISQSVTALYVSHIHTEAKGRPLFVVDKKNSKL